MTTAEYNSTTKWVIILWGACKKTIVSASHGLEFYENQQSSSLHDGEVEHQKQQVLSYQEQVPWKLSLSQPSSGGNEWDGC